MSIERTFRRTRNFGAYAVDVREEWKYQFETSEWMVTVYRDRGATNDSRLVRKAELDHEDVPDRVLEWAKRRMAEEIEHARNDVETMEAMLEDREETQRQMVAALNDTNENDD